MDFLRIRQKAKEGGAATPPEPASAPAPSASQALVESRPPAPTEEPAAPPPARRAPAAAPAGDGDPLDEFFWREDEQMGGLPEIIGSAADAVHVDAIEERSEWLTFLLGGEEYAVAIEQVREVLKAPSITEVPRAPGHVLGVIMVRGEVIAIFDPRKRLGLPPSAPARAPRVLVCDTGDGPRGLLVDAVSQVVRLPPSAIEARPTGIGGASAEYITGIGREGDNLFILLDLAAVLRDAAPAPPEVT